MPENIIEIQNVTKQFSNTAQNAVDGVSVSIPRGSFITIMGTSGSGKTTLLKTINRILDVSAGKILFEGEDIQSLVVEDYRKKIGYVIQQIGLFPHMKVSENIGVVPKSLGWDKKRIEERVQYLLNLVHLEPWVYKDRYPAQLSGGQQQRVGLARALAAEPAVMLMDEPFGAIDSLTRQMLQDELLEIHRKLHNTILFVTHDIHEAFKLGDRVIIMDKGKIQQFDTPYNILFKPENDFVRRMVDSESIIEKLQVLRAVSISEPFDYHQGPGDKDPDARIPRVNGDDTLTTVLGKFLESGAPFILVESEEKQKHIQRQIKWDSFQSIAALKNKDIEYYV